METSVLLTDPSRDLPWQPSSVISSGGRSAALFRRVSSKISRYTSAALSRPYRIPPGPLPKRAKESPYSATSCTPKVQKENEVKIMSHFNTGLISAYNSLTDKHLAGYFSNTRIRRHLRRAGLVTRSGRIVPDREYNHKLLQSSHQKHVRECLAQAIFHKVLEMERFYETDIRRKLEEFARRERVLKIKTQGRSKRCGEDVTQGLSPRPPMFAKGRQKNDKRRPGRELSETSCSPNSSRPNSAPGKMQRPVRLKPINSNSTTATVRRGSPHRIHESSHGSSRPSNHTVHREPRRRLATMEPSNVISPYNFPVINNYVTPVPPVTKRKDAGLKVTSSSTTRGRRLRNTTASSAADDLPWVRSSVHQSGVCVNMVYFGKMVHLSRDLLDLREEVKVFQQHCGGENLCVFKGMLREGESFQLVSRRHRGFPFSLTFFLNGLLVERLSSCCEFKYRKGTRLGGKHGHFGFLSVDGASPCYRCIIALGIDKKPNPPPKGFKQELEREDWSLGSKDLTGLQRTAHRENVESLLVYETSQTNNTGTQEQEQTELEDGKVGNGYEEDFEADDEQTVEEAQKKEEKEERSPSPIQDTENQVQEKDGSEIEDEENDDATSSSRSSSPGSDRVESDVETTREIKSVSSPKEELEEEDAAPVEEDEGEELNPEEITEEESALTKDSDVQDSAGRSTEIEISDNSIFSRSENKQSDDTSGETENQKTVEEENNGEEQERAKSVQEKLAEAILKESRCSSEPELSDTSTEEEYEPSPIGSKEETQEEGPEEGPEEPTLIPEEIQMVPDEETCDITESGDIPEELQESYETEEGMDDEQKPPGIIESTVDEQVHELNDDEKDAVDESIEESDELKEQKEAQLLVNKDHTAPDEETAPPPKEDKCVDATAAGDQEETEEEAAAGTDIQPEDTEQRAKSGEEDESSVLETNVAAVDTGAGAEEEEREVEEKQRAVEEEEQEVEEEDREVEEEEREVEEEQWAVETAGETTEIKEESSERQEAVSCEEETPETVTEMKEEESEGRAPVQSGAVTTPEQSNSAAEESVAHETSAESKDDDLEESPASKEGENVDEEIEADQCEEVEPEEEKPETVDTLKEPQQENEEVTEEEQAVAHIEENSTKDKEDKENSRTEEQLIDETTAKENTYTETNNVEAKVEDEEIREELKIQEDVEDSEKIEYLVKHENVEILTEEKEGDQKEQSRSNSVENDREAGNSGKDKTEEETLKLSEKEATEKAEGKEEPSGAINKPIICEKTEMNEENVEATDVSADSEDVTADPKKAAISDEATEEPIEVGNMERRGEKEEVDAENGETDLAVERGPGKVEENDIIAGAADLKSAKEDDEEQKTQESVEGDAAETEDVPTTDENALPPKASDSVVINIGVDEGGDSLTTISQVPCVDVDVPSTESKEHLDEKQLCEETEPEGNYRKSDHHHEDANLTENNLLDDNCALDPPLESQQRSVARPTGDSPVNQLHEDKNLVIKDAPAGNPPVGDEETGANAEDVSKASEEGASVLVRPQAHSSEVKEEEQEVNIQSPEALATEDSADLVTSWINVHQTSKYFQKFVDPLDELTDRDLQQSTSGSKNLDTQTTEPLVSENLEKVAGQFEDEKKQSLKDDVIDSTKAEESNYENFSSEEREFENSQGVPQEEEQTREICLPLKSEEGDRQSAKGVDDMEVQRLDEYVEEEKTESVEEPLEKQVISGSREKTLSGSHRSAVGSNSEKALEDQDAQYLPYTSPVQSLVQAPADASSKADERQFSKRSDTDGSQDIIYPESRQVIQTTGFTASVSVDGSGKESRAEELQQTESGFSGERRDFQLIDNIQQTLHKDRLSTFSVDETLFGSTSYPLLTTGRTESGH